MPARPGGGRAAAPGGVRRAGSAVTVSGRGQERTASRSATAGASPPASLSNTRPPAKTPDLAWYAAESSQFCLGGLVGPDGQRRHTIPAQGHVGEQLTRPHADVRAGL